MRYDENEKRILCGVREFVALARRRIGAALPFDEDEPEDAATAKDVKARFYAGCETLPLAFGFSSEEGDFRLFGSAKLDTGAGEMRFLVPVSSSPAHPPREVSAQARGEAFLTLFLFRETYPDKDAPKLTFLYANEQTGEEVASTETVDDKKLRAFFDKCRAVIARYAKPETDRVTKRLPSMKEARFPYPAMREGQEEFIRAVYRNLTRGTSLFACAPTGTGKTVSTVYPAIRALGAGKIDKVFYFTPKTTTANAVRDCVLRFAETGVLLRAVSLRAKERLCLSGSVCRTDRTLCENAAMKNLSDAVLSLYEKNIPFVAEDDLRAVAQEYKVCPHELSLAYSELCDLVVCDLNYLFDPKVMIRRFFTDGGNFGFLVDEAHNLPDRARETYSASISEADLEEMLASPMLAGADELKAALEKALGDFRELLFPYLKEEMREDEHGEKSAAAHMKNLPDALYPIFTSLAEAADLALYRAIRSKSPDKSTRVAALRSFYYKIKALLDTAFAFDSHYELFLFCKNGKISATLFCLDPGRQIAARVAKGHGAVFFSATLTPLDFYRDTLGGDGSSELLEVASPFAPDQLSVTVMDKITTRFSERQDSRAAVLRALAATVSAKRGNYMIFSPSFAYSEALAEGFSRMYPKIRVLSQKRDMSSKEKQAFLDAFLNTGSGYLVGFCVMGGVMSEGIDLVGERLIGAVIVGVGMPSLSFEREAIAAYYDEKRESGKLYSYIYPGLCRVLQAAGRVIRTEEDRGVIVLIDDRFDDPLYRKSLPALWKGLAFLGDAKDLRARLDAFWLEVRKEKEAEANAENGNTNT